MTRGTSALAILLATMLIAGVASADKPSVATRLGAPPAGADAAPTAPVLVRFIEFGDGTLSFGFHVVDDEGVFVPTSTLTASDVTVEWADDAFSRDPLELRPIEPDDRASLVPLRNLERPIRIVVLLSDFDGEPRLRRALVDAVDDLPRLEGHRSPIYLHIALVGRGSVRWLPEIVWGDADALREYLAANPAAEIAEPELVDGVDALESALAEHFSQQARPAYENARYYLLRVTLRPHPESDSWPATYHLYEREGELLRDGDMYDVQRVDIQFAPNVDVAEILAQFDGGRTMPNPYRDGSSHLVGDEEGLQTRIGGVLQAIVTTWVLTYQDEYWAHGQCSYRITLQTPSGPLQSGLVPHARCPGAANPATWQTARVVLTALLGLAIVLCAWLLLRGSNRSEAS